MSNEERENELFERIFELEGLLNKHVIEEMKKDIRIERLNNIINGMEKFFKYELEEEVRPLNDFKVSVWTICLDKLQELKGDSND